jgi:hypothetical protein
MRTLAAGEAERLSDAERGQIRGAADDLVLGGNAGARAEFAAVAELVWALEDTGRLSSAAGLQLVRDVFACGPGQRRVARARVRPLRRPG